MFLYHNNNYESNIINNLEKHMLYDIIINPDNNNINKKKLSLLFNNSTTNYEKNINNNNKKLNTNNNSYNNSNNNGEFNSKIKINFANNLQSANDKLFFPKNNDKLFWCFYILKNGLNDYNLNSGNTFSIEKELKINAVTYMKSNKFDIKLKKSFIENNLLYDKKLSIQSLSLFCKIYNINLRLINDNFYYEFLNNENDNFYEIYHENSKFGLNLYNNKNIDISDKLLILNIQKPINSISFYKLDDIKDLAIKLKINLLKNNKKQKIKKELYDEIFKILNVF